MVYPLARAQSLSKADELPPVLLVGYYHYLYPLEQNYLRTQWIDIHHIFSIGRYIIADYRCDLRFLIAQGTLSL